MAIVEEFFQGMVMTVVTGSHYSGGFVDDQDSETTWLGEKVQVWEESMRELLGVARKHLQSSYSRLHKSLQHEWEFIQGFTPDIGDAFVPVDKALSYSFVLYLFQGVGEEIL